MRVVSLGLWVRILLVLPMPCRPCFVNSASDSETLHHSLLNGMNSFNASSVFGERLSRCVTSSSIVPMRLSSAVK